MATTGRGRRGRGRGEGPDPTDVHVGARLRQRRTRLGLSQEKLGGQVGLTFQQIQKYERGSNRIGASRLLEFSRALEVPVAYFYEEGNAAEAGPGFAENPQEPFARDPLSQPETLELVDAYYRIADATIRRKLFDLAKSLGQGDAKSPEK